ncbi:hypothetical protein MSAN_00650700 [Mycena sanguinolenta]|uniref:Uncharacterized protein n=1 Tax=Mycena sanguinolenta TaxID=230812 RepID=A0A8H6Z3A9_9AGAR|nr:hypothetical protein MSAN_00650700 [Mycena sanguinolenta]
MVNTALSDFSQAVCSAPATAPPPEIPSTVTSWWAATGSSLVCMTQPPGETATLPPSIYTWWTDDGKWNFAWASQVAVTELPGVPGQVPSTTDSASGITVVSSVASSASLLSDVQTSTQPPAATIHFSPLPLSTTITFSPPSNSIGTSVSSSETTSSETTSASSSGALGTMRFDPQTSPSSSVSSPATSPPPIAGAASHNNNKTARIVAGVLVPLVVIALGIAAFIIYKRRQRVHDRREWERTHEEIADAVRQVGAATPAAVLAAGPPAWGDVKPVPDGDSRAPLMDSSGGTPPGSLGHLNGSDHALLSHSWESSA